MVGTLWTGKAQSRKALREDRVGLDDIRRTQPPTAASVADTTGVATTAARCIRDGASPEASRVLASAATSKNVLAWSLTYAVQLQFF